MRLTKKREMIFGENTVQLKKPLDRSGVKVMPEIKQYDWDKLRPKQLKAHMTHGSTEQFDRLFWRYKKQTPPTQTSKKHGKPTAIKDKRLFNDIYDQDSHIKSIMHEK